MIGLCIYKTAQGVLPVSFAQHFIGLAQHKKQIACCPFKIIRIKLICLCEYLTVIVGGKYYIVLCL